MLTLHPNLTHKAQQWSEDKTLHLAVAYSNPLRWRTRRELFNDFRAEMEKKANVKLYIGELALGETHFEVTEADNPQHVQLRTKSMMFHKENILNEVIRRFDPEWKYGGYVDGDFVFVRHDWGLEAVHQLQSSAWVQLFSQYTNLTARGYGGGIPAVEPTRSSFAATYIGNGHKVISGTLTASGGFPGTGKVYEDKEPKSEWVPVGATGGAWGFTRWGFETVGGLMDHCILGHGDWFMTFGLVSEPTAGDVAKSPYHPNYTAMITAWQEKAKALNKSIGVLDCYALHHFHGDMKKRGYGSRDQILVQHKFDPLLDLKKNSQGIWEFTGNKPGLRDAVHKYLRERDEDAR
jgi:hypothetical protein